MTPYTTDTTPEAQAVQFNLIRQMPSAVATQTSPRMR